MSKQLTFQVTLTFDGEVTSKEEIREIANNISKALYRQYNESNLSPDDSGVFTEATEVEHPDMDVRVVQVFSY